VRYKSSVQKEDYKLLIFLSLIHYNLCPYIPSFLEIRDEINVPLTSLPPLLEIWRTLCNENLFIAKSGKKKKRAVVKMENGYFTRAAFQNLDIVVGFVLFVAPSQDWPFA